ncbi:hypothetical protein N9766_00550 [Flavobacteriaceae bacterium]|nr:hypothetical protein [Flavobacteriaceae bacterium]
MKLNIYKNRLQKEHFTTLTIDEIFKLIRTTKSDIPKNERLGVVYASTSAKGRKHEHIESYTGMAFIDVDDCKKPKLVKLLFQELDCTIACWYSSSGNVHALIKIPVCKSKDEFKRRYSLLVKDLKEEIDDWGHIDEITSNPTQLAFISSDAEIYINEAPTTYNGIYMPTPKKVVRMLKFQKYSDASTNWCIDKAQEWFNGIDTNGYPQVLRYAITIGGWCASGKIQEAVAKETIQQLINSNQYLNSKDSSGSINTYLTGAMASFNKGLENPLEWN